MCNEPVQGGRVLFPPGYVTIRLDDRQRRAYHRIYNRYGTTLLLDIPALRGRDLDEGRPLKVTRKQFEALNRALADTCCDGQPKGDEMAFGQQERSKTRLFKRLLHLS